MKHIHLYRPRSKPLNVDSFLNGDGNVLVPGYFPVSICNLVEKNAAYGKKCGAEDRLNERTNSSRTGQSTNFWRYI